MSLGLRSLEARQHQAMKSTSYKTRLGLELSAAGRTTQLSLPSLGPSRLQCSPILPLKAETHLAGLSYGDGA